MARLENRPELPYWAEHIWEWFIELDAARQVGMTANPISFQEIAAWDSLMRHGVTDFEVSCLRALDVVRLKWSNKANDNG